jgi:seryl-tRNA synthetase
MANDLEREKMME